MRKAVAYPRKSVIEKVDCIHQMLTIIVKQYKVDEHAIWKASDLPDRKWLKRGKRDGQCK